MSAVVIADDIEADRQFIALRASKLGMTYQLATSGKEALEIAKRDVPRVLIIGTELGGIRVCGALHSAPETRSIHLVLVTPADQLAATKGWAAGKVRRTTWSGRSRITTYSRCCSRLHTRWDRRVTSP